MTRQDLTLIIEDLSLRKGFKWCNLKKLTSGELIFLANILGCDLVWEKIVKQNIKEDINILIKKVMKEENIEYYEEKTDEKDNSKL